MSFAIILKLGAHFMQRISFQIGKTYIYIEPYFNLTYIYI